MCWPTKSDRRLENQGIDNPENRGKISVMEIAKIITDKGREAYAEVVKVGSVRFDPRPGWVLLSGPLDVIPRKRDVEWHHPQDTHFVWVREFQFQQQPIA